ncbi:MAG: cyclic nucleotide-binding domain-containing protein [Planctomycetota bacterium]|nr:cyclic nucleotide-binding domain-containing protein [Planctomycetota bacterium]
MTVDIEILRRKMLFLGLTDAQLQSVAQILRSRVLKAGEVLVESGDFDETLYIVERGSVELRVAHEESFRVTAVFQTGSYVDEGFAGDFFGEFSMLDLTPWQASVVARARTVLLEINREELYDLFSRDADLKVGMVLNIARVLSRRLRFSYRQAATESIRPTT